MTLREEFERRSGIKDEKTFLHVLELALDDQKQYIKLTDKELETIQDPGMFPPSNAESERLDEIRERLLEAMVIIADIVTRRNLKHSQNTFHTENFLDKT